MEGKRKLRKLGMKISVIFVVFSLVFGIAISAFSYYMAKTSYIEFYSANLQQTVALAASFVDGDKIKEYYNTRKTDEYYDELKALLNEFKQTHEISYLYVFVPGEDKFTYIVEAQLETDNPEAIAVLGDEYMYTSLEYEQLVPDILEEKASDEVIFSSDDLSVFGQGVSAWAPVFDSEGNLVAMVEGDITIDLVISTMHRYIQVIIAITALLIVLLVVVLTVAVRKMITKPLEKLTARVQAFAVNGNPTEFVDDILTRDEIQLLSQTFGSMAGDINLYTKNQASVAAEQERLSAELALATDIQSSIVPDEIPQELRDNYFDIKGLVRSARKIGSDFYDYFMVDNEWLGFVIGDVSGNGGVPSALFMVVAKTVIKSQMMTGSSFDETVSDINSQLFKSNTSDICVNAFLGVINIETGEFKYINAGHTPPLLMRNDERYEFLAGKQAFAPLGMNENVLYRSHKLKLGQGDRIFFYSDGVVAAEDINHNEFGSEKLRTVLNTSIARGYQPEELLQHNLAELDSFTDAASQLDDYTMLIIEYRKCDKANAHLTVTACEKSIPALLSFVKRQMAENGITGKDFSVLSVVTEEVFVLCKKTLVSGDIVVRCSVSQTEGTLLLRFTGDFGSANPLERFSDSVSVNSLKYVSDAVDSISFEPTEGSQSIVVKKTSLPIIPPPQESD